MSCNSCNKLGSSCTCTDNALTTPCSYTECNDPAAEPCESVQCLKCVSNCGTAFSVDLLSGTFKVDAGERLRDTLQNLLLYLKDPTCLATAPSNLAASNLTASTITLTWELSTPAPVDVEYKAVASGGWTVAQAGLNGNTFQITDLLSNTDYMFRVTNGVCESVEIYATTL